MMYFQSYWLLLSFFFVGARDPFSFNKNRILKTCKLKGTVIGDYSFAHIGHDKNDLIVGVNDAIGDWIVVEIHFEKIILKNKNGKNKTLKIDESMKMGEGA